MKFFGRAKPLFGAVFILLRVAIAGASIEKILTLAQRFTRMVPLALDSHGVNAFASHREVVTKTRL